MNQPEPINSVATEQVSLESATEQSLLQQVVEQSAKTTASSIPSAPSMPLQLGRIDDIDADNQLWISYGDHDYAVNALSAAPIGDDDIGRICTLAFLGNDPQQPIVMGLIHTPNSQPETLNISAEKSVHLRCGNAELSMDQTGHINLQGMSINNQAYGPNRIKGGSVKIN